MKNNTLKKTLLFAVILLIASLSVYAFAHSGRNHMRGFSGMGYGNHMGYGMNYYRGGHMLDSLSIDDQAKMQEQMNAFFSDTKEIREKKYNKRLELNQEYSKSEVDNEKIKRLQSELFDLSSQFEKQRFEHRATMQELFGNQNNRYNTGRGYGRCFN